MKDTIRPAIPEREASVAKLADYFAGMQDGEFISWLRIEADTGQPMVLTGPGRNDVRRALRRIKRPYEAVRGEGVRLSAPENAMTIVRGRFVRIDGAVRIADRTQRQLQERHLDKMNPAEQQKMIMLAGFFGAIRVMVKENTVKILKT